MDDDITERAVTRQARARLNRLERRADVARLLRRGADRDHILGIVDIDGNTLDRLTRALTERPLEADETAEEVILRAFVERSDRALLVEILGGLEQDSDQVTYGVHDVLDGLREGLVTLDELTEVWNIRAVSERAAREGWLTTRRTAEAIREAHREEDVARLLQTIVEARAHVHQIIGEARDLVAAWRAMPARVESRWDALLAAVVEHEFAAAGLDVPAWTTALLLDEDWVHEYSDVDEVEVRKQTPPWLAERRIFICHRDLT